MKKLFILFFFLIRLPVIAQEFPPKPDPPRLVNDYAGLISDRQAEFLEQKLVAFNDSTSTQIAVVILKTLDGYPASDYAFKLGELWGIGQKGTNNGVLVLVSVEERSMYIATGYGLEGALPDALCKRIIENDIKPHFREKDYYTGLDRGTSQIISAVKGEYKPTTRKKNVNIPWTGIFIAAGLFLFIFIITVRRVGRHARLNGIPFWLAWQLLNAAKGGSRRSNWGGFSGGGGFGGGGGGGFGGFGGGSFGGGGAGGSW